MRRTAVITAGSVAGAVYVFGASALAYSAWYGSSDTLPVISTADVLTGWATLPRHAAQWLISNSWDLEGPQPVEQLALWDAICTGAVAVLNVAVVVTVAKFIARRRRNRHAHAVTVGS